MRQLTAKQKRVIEKALKEYADLGIRGVEDLPLSIWDELVAINDTEILYQTTDRYIRDLIFSGGRK